MTEPTTKRPPPLLMNAAHAPPQGRVPRAARAPSTAAPQEEGEKVHNLSPEEVQTIPPVAAPSAVAANMPPLPPSARVPQFEGRRSEFPAPPSKTEPEQRACVIGFIDLVLIEWASENPDSTRLKALREQLEDLFPELKRARSIPPQPPQKS